MKKLNITTRTDGDTIQIQIKRGNNDVCTIDYTADNNLVHINDESGTLSVNIDGHLIE